MPAFRYTPVDGDTIALMRENMQHHRLRDHGDAVLVWINEGDLVNGECVTGHHPGEKAAREFDVPFSVHEIPADPQEPKGGETPAGDTREMVSLPKDELMEMLDIVDEMAKFCSVWMPGTRYKATSSAHWVIAHRVKGNNLIADEMKASLMKKRTEWIASLQKPAGDPGTTESGS